MRVVCFPCSRDGVGSVRLLERFAKGGVEDCLCRVWCDSDAFRDFVERIYCGLPYFAVVFVGHAKHTGRANLEHGAFVRIRIANQSPAALKLGVDFAG